MSKCRLTVAPLVFGLMTFVCTATAAPPSAGINRHCFVKFEPAGSDASQLVPGPTKCYPTFRDAIFFATGGSILLPSKQPFSVQLEILDQELKARQDELKAAGSYVVAIDYEHINYGGASYAWVFPGPCTPSVSFYANSMPSSWWNDRVSSTRGFSDCDRNVLWEHSYRWGASLACLPDCSSVGSMNDKTSSREWHNCTGTAGGWRGCRGTGCHVCAELVADYPCYFQNHPLCISNSTCAQDYYICNAKCPAPTEADKCPPPPPPTCSATASCANAGGGSVSCSGTTNDCFAFDDCYAYCDGQYYFCPNPPGVCPL
jgi:hypothetical protein